MRANSSWDRETDLPVQIERWVQSLSDVHSSSGGKLWVEGKEVSEESSAEEYYRLTLLPFNYHVLLGSDLSNSETAQQ